MYKILAVDDEIEILKVIDEFLTQAGFMVKIAQDAEAGLEILAKEKPDLLILDMRMPGIGGEGLLRELSRKKIDIPAIILTGYARTDAGLGFVKKDSLKILVKPVNLSILLETVNECLRGKRDGQTKDPDC
ncbi:MAG: response regulator [Candidatus Omnitrophica bacterium]|nr:response regulator [Candidatus Omnitrophota bacterium]